VSQFRPFSPTDKHQLSQMDPRDALPHARCAVNRASDSALSLTMRALFKRFYCTVFYCIVKTKVGDRCDKLTADRRIYCQLSRPTSVQFLAVYPAKRPRLSS